MSFIFRKYAMLMTLLAGVVLISTACKRDESVVVVYTSQDQVYAEPIFETFTRETGIHVKAVYDNEAVKTVGLANRIIAERGQPQCDVFWNNEELRTRQLAEKGLFREREGWSSFGFRTRRLVINTNLVSLSDAPKTLAQLTNASWHGKVALAYPLFGTTATHFMALRRFWGPVEWERWCRALANNKPMLVDGNSVVVKIVGGGQVAIGMTDSDDIRAGQREGLPIVALPVSEETLFIPNTVAVLKGAPHPEQAERLAQYLRVVRVVNDLISVGALDGATPPPDASSVVVSREVVAEMEPAIARMKEIFLR